MGLFGNGRVPQCMAINSEENDDKPLHSGVPIVTVSDDKPKCTCRKALFWDPGPSPM